jgi:hypothetical protein
MSLSFDLRYLLLTAHSFILESLCFLLHLSQFVLGHSKSLSQPTAAVSQPLNHLAELFKV